MVVVVARSKKIKKNKEIKKYIHARVYLRKKTRKHNDFDEEKKNILKSTDIRANECMRLVHCAYPTRKYIINNVDIIMGFL
jgi:hypothetical protein